MFLPSPSRINSAVLSGNTGVVDLFSHKFSGKLYGVILRDTPLRISLKPSFSPEGFDLDCETLCRCCEPVVFQEASPRGDFYKVQTCCSVGFVHRDHVALISRNCAEKLMQGENLLYITDKFVITNPAPISNISKIPLSFGTKIPYIKKDLNYSVFLPEKDKNGKAVWIKSEISPCPGTNCGPLRFTRKNILQLALRMRGMPYDWGESFGGCDCSSLIRAAFSLCGVNLPRNSSDIARIPCKAIPFNCGINTLCLCKPGDIICGDGHVMLYYAKKRGIHYVFHSFYGTRGITDITPVTEPTSDGMPLYEKFRKIIPLNSICT